MRDDAHNRHYTDEKMKTRQFILSTLIFLFLWLPIVLIGMVVTPFLLLTKWNGRTTWFGNYLYGRIGNSHMPPNPTLFDEWWFLAVRNPASNFGKEVLSVKNSRGWPWLYDRHVVGRLYWMYGWKNPVGGYRTFVFRPWLHKKEIT